MMYSFGRECFGNKGMVELKEEKELLGMFVGCGG